MSPNSRPGSETAHTSDRAVAGLASRQHGNVTRAQLRRTGLNDTAIATRARAGRLHRVHRGVYAVGRPPVTAIERAHAAVLACAPHGVLCHRSALALWGLVSLWELPLHVAVTSGHRRPSGIVVHRLALDARDLTVHDGIPITTLPRTLLDCAPTLSARALTRAVNDARHDHRLSLGALAETLARSPWHPGKARLRPHVETTDGPTRSPWEDDFPGFCARFGLPAPQMNVTVCGLVVDAYFAKQRVIVELDGWAYHNDRASFETDRARDALTSAHGHVTVRLTRARLREDSEREAGLLRATLAHRGPGGPGGDTMSRPVGRPSAPSSSCQ